MGSTGDETIENFGTFSSSGDIHLGAGANAFNNHMGAVFNSGSEVNLGADNLFTNAGTLSPGNNLSGTDPSLWVRSGDGIIHTTALVGNFLNTSTGVYVVTVDGVNSDHLDVTGAATLEGGIVRFTTVNSATGSPYTILTAAGDVTGTFGDLLFDDYDLSYDDNTVFATRLAADAVPGFCEVAGTANQHAVCGGIGGLPRDNEVVQTLIDNIVTEDEARDAYDALSGQVHAALTGTMMENGQKRIATINDRVNHGHADDQQVSTYGLAWGDGAAQGGWWLSGYGSWGDKDATGNTHQMDTTASGMMAGLDTDIGDWRLGLVAGTSRGNVTQDALLSSGDVSTWSAGLYGSGTLGGMSLSAGALYNWHNVETSRTVSAPGFAQTLSADYAAQSAQIFGELGYALELDRQVLTPFAGISHVSLDTDGFTEIAIAPGGSSAALTAADNSHSATFTTLGLRAATQIGDKIQARGMIGWRHGFGDTNPTSSFTLSGSNAFTVAGAPVTDNAIVGELGVAINISPTATLGATYSGQYGDGTSEHGIKASFKLRF